MATIRGDPKAKPIRVRPTPIQPARIETGTYQIIDGGKPYSGEYSVTPTRQAQVLPTEGYYMERNLTVEPIPKNYGLITWDGSVLTVS